MNDKKENPARGRKAPPHGKKAAEPKAKAGPPVEAQAADGGERIAKRLARAGVASRRDAEAMVIAGRVKVNGRILASPAHNVRPSDRIEVDDAPIPEVERTRLFVFHKPAGIVTTSRDPEGRKTVFDILPPSLPRLVTVGRLDINTEGLLLLTNDGGLARVLELPSTGWLRRYRVRVHGRVEPAALAELEKGVAVDGVFYGAITAVLDRQQGSNAWLTLGLREGKNREVKNVLGALGLDVTRLIRVSYGPFQLGDLAEGAVQEIKGRMLRDQLGERLIEEAGANFDAPVTQPFANKPVRVEKPARPAEPAGAGEGARKPVAFRKKREERREELRGRLQTRPPASSNRDRGPKNRDRDKDKDKGKGSKGAPIERRSRASNVWMAPGARPVGKKRAEEGTEKTGAPDKPRKGPGGRGGKPGERPTRNEGRPPRRGKPPTGRGPKGR